MSTPPPPTSMANYNLTRHVDDLLNVTQNLPPSFTVHLKSAHWCLNNFNAGAKFAYNHQVAVRFFSGFRFL